MGKERRPSAALRGYDWEWTKFRAAFLAGNPYCIDCQRQGREVAAVDVDHEPPLEGGRDDPGRLDHTRCRALCHACHSSKTCALDGALGQSRRRVGDGGEGGEIVRQERSQAAESASPAGRLWNRVVERRQMRGDELLANARNWRQHPTAQAEALRGILEEVGMAGELLAYHSERNGGKLTLIDGHLRSSEFAGEVWDVAVTDLNDSEADKLLLVHDPLAAMATANKDALERLIRETQTGSQALAGMMTALADASGIVPPAAEPAADPGAQIDKAAELQAQWGTAPGQLWVIPSKATPGKAHRLLCGDSTKAEDVARVMGGEKAEMVWTDPPYGVGIGDKNKFLNSIAPSNRVEENLTNDTLSEEDLSAMLASSFGLAAQHCTAGAAWYVAAPPGPLHLLFAQAMKDLGILRQMLIWVKNNATFSPMGVSYHWRHEPVFYGWMPNGGHRYHGDRKQDTVWEIDRPQASPEHPTMKPPELVARAIEHSSLAGELVYEPFSGSGTTLVAAEQTGRICHGIEISPAYVAVALERMKDLGLDPRQETAS